MSDTVDAQGNPLDDAVVGSRPPVRLRQEITATLDKACHEATVAAIRAGHDPFTWTRTTYSAATACRRCGAAATITVRADLSVEQAGALTAASCR